MISQSDLETYLELDAGTDTELLTDIEAGVVAFVERYTHRFFGAAAEVTEEVYVGDGSDTLFLKEEPDTAQTITVVEQAHPGATQTTITAGNVDGYVVRDRKLVRKGGHEWIDGYEYLVTYTRGYTENAAGPPADIAAPDEIRTAVKKLVAHEYREVKRKDQGLTQEKLGDRSYAKGAPYSFEEGLLKQLGVFPALRSWRRMRL